MASRDETIQMVVRARDEASGTLRNVENSLKGLENAVSGPARILGSLGAIAAVGGLVTAANEMMRLGAVSAQTESALGALAGAVGSNADAMVAAMNKAAMGTVSNFDLMLAANRSLQFEIAKTPEEMAKLVELATALGRATGRSDTQALEDLSTGLARESRLILDNLGLLIDIEKVTKEYAATLGKAANELTAYERKQALLNEAFRQGATALKANRDASESAATRIERFDASVANLRDSWGRLIALMSSDSVAAMGNAIGALADRMNNSGTLDGMRNQLAELKNGLAELESGEAISIPGFGQINANDSAIAAYREAIAETEQAILQMASSQASANGSMQQAADLSMMAADAHGNAARAAMDLGHSTRMAAMEASFLAAAALDGANGLSQLEAMAWSTASSLDMAAGAMARMNQVAGGLQAIRTQGIGQLESTLLRIAEHGGDADQLAATYGQAADQIFNMGLSMENTAEAQFANKLAVQATLEPYQQQLDGILEAERATNRLARSTGGAGAAVQQMSQEYSNLQSKVSSVLSGAFNLDVGVDTESILGREDAINEDARRLADVAVNGFNSPWYSYLKEKFPDTIGAAFEGADPKTAAAKLLKDFEDGLRPELINKDMAKERVRRMLIGEANTKAMVDEIAKELATEMGISINKVRAAAGGALGLADVATGGAAGDGVPVDIKPIIDQTLLQPITNLTSAPLSIPITLDTTGIKPIAEIVGATTITIDVTLVEGAGQAIFEAIGAELQGRADGFRGQGAAIATMIHEGIGSYTPEIGIGQGIFEAVGGDLQSNLDRFKSQGAAIASIILSGLATYTPAGDGSLSNGIIQVFNSDVRRSTADLQREGQAIATVISSGIAAGFNSSGGNELAMAFVGSVNQQLGATQNLFYASGFVPAAAVESGFAAYRGGENALAMGLIQSINTQFRSSTDAFMREGATAAQAVAAGFSTAWATQSSQGGDTGGGLPFGSTMGMDFSGPALAMATGFVDAFIVEFDAVNPGQYVIESLSAKIAENYQALDEGAKGMGMRWGNMFLSAVSESVPIPLIELLVTLVTPAVRDKLSQQASQTGANNTYLPIYNQ